MVHLFTHAALYIPREMVQAVRNHAHIAAVFILPSGGKLDLDYLDLLNAHWVVDHATLAHGAARADAAKSILVESQEVGRKSLAEGELAPVSQRPAPSVRGGAAGAAGPASVRGPQSVATGRPSGGRASSDPGPKSKRLGTATGPRGER